MAAVSVPCVFPFRPLPGFAAVGGLGPGSFPAGIPVFVDRRILPDFPDPDWVVVDLEVVPVDLGVVADPRWSWIDLALDLVVADLAGFDPDRADPVVDPGFVDPVADPVAVGFCFGRFVLSVCAGPIRDCTWHPRRPD